MLFTRFHTAPLVLLLLLVVTPSPAQESAVKGVHRNVPHVLDNTAAAASRDRALAWLVRTQNKNGSWASGAIEGLLDSGYSVASFYDWQYAANCIACMALMECPETPKRRTALEKGIRWLMSSRLPKRGSDWDNDTIWAALYGVVACVDFLDDPRFSGSDWKPMIATRGKALLDILLKNQIPTGGWAYYDDPPYSRRPKWGTSFTTALILPALKRAKEMGWFGQERVIERAIAYVKRCRLPNGAYEYDLNPIPRAPSGEHINKIEGSLGRIQVCHWALRACEPGSVNDDQIRRGMDSFMAKHKFLDVARMRPIPHEAYYANAGYFYFFGHYYASQVIGFLPKKEQESWHAKLRPHIVKTQRKDGSFCDFLGQGYLVVSGTAYAALSLNSGLASR